MMLQASLPTFEHLCPFWGKMPAAFHSRYLQGKGQAVPGVVLIRFQLFYLLLQLQPLFISLLQDLLPLSPELVL